MSLTEIHYAIFIYALASGVVFICAGSVWAWYKFLYGLRWLLTKGFIFPNTVRAIHEETITELTETNDQLDCYIVEMEKRELGIFR